MPLTEKSLIAGIRDRARPGQGIILGIGDDCSILRIPPGHEVLVTTDFSLEGMHFRREWHPPEVVGHRCLARGLSDIAAMGGEPIAAFLSLALPGKTKKAWVDRFLNGLLNLADAFHVTLAGGDTAESPDGVLADIVVIGSVPKGKAIRRSGARPGDRVYVSGSLGGAAAAFKSLFSGRRLTPKNPVPRIALGRFLREKKLASAMIDVSDGLSTDLGHICEESGVGAEIRADAIPLARIGRQKREVDLKFALHGGDDYELLFTAPQSNRIPQQIAGVPTTQVGKITRDKSVVLIDGGLRHELKPQGWQHFQK